ncbi:MAG: mandelate racemase/muconate lactonizing enzyme family protein [Gammaproteobacteria bacterium]|nr:mandelate racemase/muconate lactonizing enzyme family protein [Gammaproteobacteria bacterium]MDA7995274.1 mandelate racemase/muconate lactonizing enzyme family protein [Gammaproteobacteria bacterium]CAJ2376500.1 MAG: Mandelate racemase [Arenicellales bacterium IbO2]
MSDNNIARIETFATEFVCMVKATAADGAYGWGQTAPYHADITAQIVHRQIAPHALGADAGAIEKLAERIPELEHKFPGSHLYRALGGLDTALWDLRGRRAGKPVCALLGGAPGKVRAYASSMKRDIDGKTEVARLAKLRGQFGFDAFKFRVASECGHDADEWPGRSEDIVARMHAEFGKSECALLVDANSGYSPTKAIAFGKFLEDHGVSHFEEPCPYWELEQTKQVTDALDIDVTGGEQDCELPTWRRMLEMHAVNVAQPDICYVGGLTRALRVAETAAAHGLPCTPHAANLSMVTIFTMHFLRAIKNPGKYLEFSIEGEDYYPWQRGLFLGEPFTVEDGCVSVGDAPGWGVEISPDWLRASRRQVSEL